MRAELLGNVVAVKEIRKVQGSQYNFLPVFEINRFVHYRESWDTLHR